MNKVLFLLVVLTCIWGCSGRKGRANDLFLKAKVALSENRLWDAHRYLVQAVKLDSSFKEAHSNLGSVLLELGKFQPAIEAFSRAIAIDPAYSLAYFNRANAYYKIGKPEMALNDLQRATLLAPDSAFYHLNLGTILSELKRPGEALLSFQMAESLGSKDPSLFSNISSAFLMNGDTLQSIAYARKAIQTRGMADFAHNNLGLVALARGQLTQAALQFDSGLSVNPANPALLNNRGYTAFLSSDTVLAIKFIKKSLLYNPKNALAHRNLALVLLASDPKSALLSAQKAIELDSTIEAGYSVLAAAYAKNGDQQGLCRAYLKAKTLRQKISVLPKDCQ